MLVLFRLSPSLIYLKSIEYVIYSMKQTCNIHPLQILWQKYMLHPWANNSQVHISSKKMLGFALKNGDGAVRNAEKAGLVKKVRSLSQNMLNF